MNVPTLKELSQNGLDPEILFWVGCAGSFDERAKKITKSFVKLLNKANISFGVLGIEESCTGDPAKRAGNEFLYQMQAVSNIETLNSYNFKKIVTTCPHCFNTIKNEYPSLGGNYDVIHHTQLLDDLIKNGKIKVQNESFKGKKITFHDPCYLGRANKEFKAPRNLIDSVKADLKEMKSCKEKGLCCGAGGAQMFKDAEKGNEEINIKRTKEAIDTNAKIIAAGCPFCNTMLSDGLKNQKAEQKVKVLDIAEIVEQASID
ncbi:MAG: (Fe-S)-binding protein [Pelagibacteraceae bacterium TMED267]|jgi:Fe-S oxidoreductase|nr:MAG: (Fe-S)-binding protein [Cryomorphaceae bacterium]RPG04762.1 MAG: (Fe-S)-binding protein [Pelagibacteraceae bacterium TMED267]|tara:strand:+ start:245 stop:1024 length:780 start_codon:yes stop_codon:yes gene_type:complete